jgi:hypothetical protein
MRDSGSELSHATEAPAGGSGKGLRSRAARAGSCSPRTSSLGTAAVCGSAAIATPMLLVRLIPAQHVTLANYSHRFEPWTASRAFAVPLRRSHMHPTHPCPYIQYTHFILIRWTDAHAYADEASVRLLGLEQALLVGQAPLPAGPAALLAGLAALREPRHPALLL